MIRSKPLVVLDVDGVVADLVGTLKGRLQLPEDHPVTEWDLSKSFDKYDYSYIRGMMKQQHFWETLKAYPEGVAMVHRIRKRADILWCSSPFVPCSGWVAGRLNWLRSILAIRKYKEPFIATRDKQFVRGRVLIDDKPENVTNWALTGRPAILLDQEWNQDYASPNGLVVRGSWDEVDEILTSAFLHASI